MNTFATILAVIVVILAIIFGPFAMIWSVNTLFPVAAIPYTFDTWVAAIVLAGVFKANVTVKK
jgi:hypothetical protein